MVIFYDDIVSSTKYMSTDMKIIGGYAMDLIFSGLLIGALMGVFLILWDSFAPSGLKSVGQGGNA